jgi:hypothetical protein
MMFPHFFHRFSLRKSILSPFFHHVFTIFPPFFQEIHPKMVKTPSVSRSFFRRGAKCMTSLGRQLSGRMATGRLESEPWLGSGLVDGGRVEIVILSG